MSNIHTQIHTEKHTICPFLALQTTVWVVWIYFCVGKGPKHTLERRSVCVHTDGVSSLYVKSVWWTCCAWLYLSFVSCRLKEVDHCFYYCFSSNQANLWYNDCRDWSSFIDAQAVDKWAGREAQEDSSNKQLSCCWGQTGCGSHAQAGRLIICCSV